MTSELVRRPAEERGVDRAALICDTDVEAGALLVVDALLDPTSVEGLKGNVLQNDAECADALPFKEAL